MLFPHLGQVSIEHFCCTVRLTLHRTIIHLDSFFLLCCIGDEIRGLQKSLVDHIYQLNQLHQQLASADRQRSTLQAKILSDEIMQQQVRTSKVWITDGGRCRYYMQIVKDNVLVYYSETYHLVSCITVVVTVYYVYTIPVAHCMTDEGELDC